ncbi:hypothetical protein SPRG_09671 [Saprolegnia parasitica CBS 223.65]|uniref:Uncharacterized protein n=1 Tax=Saprolegnia parasitica (strain CBS 223.65) TaxID=695850 RepID=A0A067C2U8_SAPPC|nr:hypothetical protein SPRG_09671 [Saprolegnia parasitica CBS 223.65]KDO24838.1 hypothetical protein SPRG_09671 [Saprolegnia parasitica CBS 223.65]|eukprot:XP_012204485.1 hypothetical protein SPRG_09671 [Saprolegnia parasitica CBS 223.65]
MLRTTSLLAGTRPTLAAAHGHKPKPAYGQLRFFSAKRSKKAAAPVAKEAAVEKSAGLDPYVRDIGFYMITAATLLVGTSYYKSMNEDDSTETLVFLQAKHTAIRNKVVIDITGLPTKVEMLPDAVQDGATIYSGTIGLEGERGKTVVHYTADASVTDENGKYALRRLDLIQADGSVVSLLKPQPTVVLTDAEDAQVKEQRKGELKALISKLALPALLCFGVGCTAGYVMLRILKNRPSYIIQMGLDRVNQVPKVKDFLGHPIKTNKNTYVGAISDTSAKFESVCKGPKGEGTMYVQATRPNTASGAWEFTHLSMGIKGRAKKITIVEPSPKSSTPL